MRQLLALTLVAMLLVVVIRATDVEKPKAQNRQMMPGLMPGAGGGGVGYMPGMSFYHPAQSMMGMGMQVPARPMGMGMGMGMPGMPSPGGQMMYQQQMQPPFMSPYQSVAGQPGGGMFQQQPPIRYTPYPNIVQYGAPQMPQHDHFQGEEEEIQDEGEAGTEVESEDKAAS